MGDDLAAALGTALQAVAVAREILLAECARPAGPRGPIGHCPADDEVEWIIRERLLVAFPDWGYLGEETGSQERAPGADCVWIVDPNDGTSTMQRGYRGHSVSIGLVRRGVPVLGVVCAVDAPDDRGDLIAWAEGCGGLRRNGKEVELSPLPIELTAETIVGLSLGANRNPVGNLACVAPARFLGIPSVAYRLALVAVGECAATVSLQHLSAWDYAAGHALVRAAGGVVVDEHGRDMVYRADGQGGCTRIFGGARRLVDRLVPRSWDRVSGSGFGEGTPPPGLAPARPQPGNLVHASEVLSRAHGCLLGQIAGDALGALVEFASADEIDRRYPTGGPRSLTAGGPHRIIAGQPTDDSELALMLARSLMAQDGEFTQAAVAAGYARWFHGWTHADAPQTCGHHWCKPFDVGQTTTQALRIISAADLRDGQAASRAVESASQQSQANGALMRISPLGIWGTFRTEETVATCARLDAQLTHPHRVCQDASALFAITLSATIRDGLNAQQAHERAVAFGRRGLIHPHVQRAVEAATDSSPTDFYSHQGWVLIALQNAFFQVLHAPSFEAAVVATVRHGGDTDTNAAICGALAGAIHGREAVPLAWRQLVLSCRPMAGRHDVQQPRPALYWPTDALVLAERLLASGIVRRLTDLRQEAYCGPEQAARSD